MPAGTTSGSEAARDLRARNPDGARSVADVETPEPGSQRSQGGGDLAVLRVTDVDEPVSRLRAHLCAWTGRRIRLLLCAAVVRVVASAPRGWMSSLVFRW